MATPPHVPPPSQPDARLASCAGSELAGCTAGRRAQQLWGLEAVGTGGGPAGCRPAGWPPHEGATQGGASGPHAGVLPALTSTPRANTSITPRCTSAGAWVRVGGGGGLRQQMGCAPQDF